MATIFQMTFSNAFSWMKMYKFLLQFHWICSQEQINNIPASVQIIAWCRPDDKPLSEPMMVSLLTHICVARPQWVECMLMDLHMIAFILCKQLYIWSHSDFFVLLFMKAGWIDPLLLLEQWILKTDIKTGKVMSCLWQILFSSKYSIGWYTLLFPITQLLLYVLLKIFVQVLFFCPTEIIFLMQVFCRA